MNLVEVKIKKLSPTAILPRYVHSNVPGGNIGADLYADVDIVIPSQQLRLVSTGISVAFPPGIDMQIRSKSGLAANRSVFVLNSPGTIDPIYRGEVGVILYNLGDKPFEVKKGDKIAQAVFTHFLVAKFEEVSELEDTIRGEGGFGSTGR